MNIHVVVSDNKNKSISVCSLFYPLNKCILLNHCLRKNNILENNKNSIHKREKRCKFS